MNDRFDYLIVGGGSGGCVVAGRLTEDPNVSVCLVEAGGKGNQGIINIPVSAAVMVPSRINNWAFESVPQAGLDGRTSYLPRGKVLGGSSAINAMVYIRGHRADYDYWASLGNRGWSYEEVLPYFIRSEHHERFDGPWHGRTGPLWVSDLRTDSPFHDRFKQAAQQCGLPVTDDFNGAEQEGLGCFQVTQHHGERWSAARAYLLPHLGRRDNLSVRTDAQVQRIVFEGRRAVAVDILETGRVTRIFAQREIILCAGALQSPQILKLSGIGPAQELSNHGIAVIHDLPGVGENLQDHPDFVFGYRCRGSETMGISLRGGVRLAREAWHFHANRTGMLTSNFAECGGFLRTQREFPVPDIQLHLVLALVENHARTPHWGHGLTCHVCLLRPRSRGHVRLRDRDPQSLPIIDPALLADSRDLDDLLQGFKLTRRLMNAPALADSITEELWTADLNDDDAIRVVIRRRADNIYHPVGTCRMGTDEFAVVDPQLRVRGVDGLRVVDASVMPTLIGGNTNAPTIMIAEKGVDMIRGVQAPPSTAASHLAASELA